MEDKILQELPGVKKNVLLKYYTTYKIGGPAKYFFAAKSKEELIEALKEAKKNRLPVFILGGGSNLLVSDKGFNGLVIRIQNSKFRVQNSGEIYVDAGVNSTKLSYATAEASLSGLEWAAGIPGTVGGAIYGNAQAFGTKISDAVESVEAVNIKRPKGYPEIKNFTKKQCRFSLKNSIFKRPQGYPEKWVIISAVLKLNAGNQDGIKNKMKEFLDYRKTYHPLDFPSCGSTFVNPEIRIRNKKILQKFPELKEYSKKGIIPAGYLISKSGLAGKISGGAQISEKHCNFIINLGGAKAKDVLSLIKLARSKVKKNFGIKLEPEVQFVGFNAKII